MEGCVQWNPVYLPGMANPKNESMRRHESMRNSYTRASVVYLCGLPLHRHISLVVNKEEAPWFGN